MAIHPKNPLGLGLSLRTQASPPTASCATAPRFVQFWHSAAFESLSLRSCPALCDEGQREWKYELPGPSYSSGFSKNTLKLPINFNRLLEKRDLASSTTRVSEKIHHILLLLSLKLISRIFLLPTLYPLLNMRRGINRICVGQPVDNLLISFLASLARPRRDIGWSSRRFLLSSRSSGFCHGETRGAC